MPEVGKETQDSSNSEEYFGRERVGVFISVRGWKDMPRGRYKATTSVIVRFIKLKTETY